MSRARLVLVHGSPATGDAWRPVVPFLSSTFDVATPTLSGHGVPENEAFLSMGVDDLASALEADITDDEGPLDLLAYSFGCIVALRMALRGRCEISRMLLLEPVALPVLKLVGKGDAFLQTKSIFDAYDEYHRAGEPYAVSRMINFWFGDGAFDVFPEPVRDYLDALTEINLRDIKASMAETYRPEELDALKMPIEVVCGDRSPAVTGAIARALTELLGDARVTSLAGATQAMLTTHPEEVADLAKAFFSR